MFVCIGLGMFAVIGGLVMLSSHYTLNGIKSKTVGDGQYGTARFATEKEIREIYAQHENRNYKVESRKSKAKIRVRFFANTTGRCE